MSEPERLNEILVRKSFAGQSRKSQRLELIRTGWESVAGDLSSHTVPTRLSRGTLTVRADGAAWAAEASLASDAILRRLELMLGKAAVRRVKVQGAGLPAEESGPTGASRKTGPPGGALRAAGQREVGEEEVRRALERLAAASKATEQSEQD